MRAIPEAAKTRQLLHNQIVQIGRISLADMTGDVTTPFHEVVNEIEPGIWAHYPTMVEKVPEKISNPCCTFKTWSGADILVANWGRIF